MARHEQELWKVRQEMEAQMLQEELVREKQRLKELRLQEEKEKFYKQGKEDLHVQMLEQRVIRDQEEREMRETPAKWVEEINSFETQRKAEIERQRTKRVTQKEMLDMQVRTTRALRNREEAVEKLQDRNLMDRAMRQWEMRHEYEARRRAEQAEDLRRTWDMQLRQRMLEQELLDPRPGPLSSRRAALISHRALSSSTVPVSAGREVAL